MWLSLGDAERRVAHGLARTPQMAGTAGRTVGQGEEGDLGFSLLPGITLDRPGKGEAERSLCCPRFGRAAGLHWGGRGEGGARRPGPANPSAGSPFSGTRRDGRTCQVLSVCPALLCSARCPRRLACVDCLTSLPLLQLPAEVGQWEVPTELGRETERVSPGYLFSRLPFCQAAPGWLCVHLENVTVLFTWG